jgi:hypothetical protein
MSYDDMDAARDAFYEELRTEAVADFTSERLKSYYVRNPTVMRPAVDAIQEGRWQQEHERHSAALVFFVSAVELLFKATLLRPVIYGLVHNEALAEAVMLQALRDLSLERYADLLKDLFLVLAKVDVKAAQ